MIVPLLLTELSQLVGRTITVAEACFKPEGIAMRFCDDALAILEIEHGYEGETNVVLHRNADDIEPILLFKLGLYSAEDFNVVTAQRHAQRQALEERRDRETLKRLQEKYKP